MKATQSACLNNVKQLALGWIMYSDDNNDTLVNLNTYGTDAAGNKTPLTSAAHGIPWRVDIGNGQLIIPGVAMPPTTEANWKLATEMGFKQPTPTIEGPLYKYCKNPDVVHCPGDKRYQRPVGSGYSWDSYSGATFLNGEAAGKDSRNLSRRSWGMNNYGTAALNFTDAQFLDSPAAFHITSAVFNFCDGHAEGHKWMSSYTIAFGNDTTPGKDSGGTSQSNANAPPGGGKNPDLQWIGSHYPGGQNP